MLLRHFLLTISAVPAIALGLLQPAVFAASFDCAKAGNTLEHTICDHAELNAADGHMGDLYRELRAGLAKSAQNELKQEQRDWLKQRTRICAAADADCLLPVYQQRIAGLQARLSGGNETPAVRAGSPESFIPQGWQVLQSVQGDLNQDKRDDVAMVLAQLQEVQDMEAERILLVLLQQADGSFQEAIETGKAILCRGCGGVFGDPLESIAVDNGTLVITHYGGSRDRWGYVHRFRLQDGDWYMIGRTETYHDTLSQKSEITDENLLTGTMTVDRVSEAGRETKETLEMGKETLPQLSTFDITQGL
jgi:uncharacterized protein YecT (DUF1311 family)